MTFGAVFLGPVDMISTYFVQRTSCVCLRPYINAHIGEVAPCGVYRVVYDPDMIAPGNRHSILTYIDEDIIFCFDIGSAIITQHDAAAGLARTAAPDLVARDHDRVVSHTMAFIDIYRVLGITLAQYVFKPVVAYPASRTAYIIELNKLPARNGAHHIFTLAIGYANRVTIGCINTRCHVSHIAIVYLDIGATIQINTYVGRIADPAIGDVYIMAISEIETYLVAAIDAVALDGDIMRVVHTDGRDGFMRMAKILGVGIRNTDAHQQEKQFFHRGFKYKSNIKRPSERFACLNRQK